MEMETRITGLRKGAWTKEEDALLKNCIEKHGEGNWKRVPLLAGLNRCRKSCRLRWLNYLSPKIERGCFTQDEVDLIIRLHKLLGNRWALIAGRLPGRTANSVKNFWNTHLVKYDKSSHGGSSTSTMPHNNVIIKPRPRTFTKPIQINQAKEILQKSDENLMINTDTLFSHVIADSNDKEGVNEWWGNLLQAIEVGELENTLWFCDEMDVPMW